MREHFEKFHLPFRQSISGATSERGFDRGISL
jgi:hypothetical protein